MGIKDLTKFLKENVPESIKEDNLSMLNGKTAAIDISIFLYKFKYKNKNMIQKFLEQINRLKLHKITPIYIFDGPPPKQKLNTIIERKEKYDENNKKKENIINEIKSLEEKKNPINNPRIRYLKSQINKIDDTNIRITKEDIKNIKYFFDLLNINYIQAPQEADILCSKLCNNGYADMVISEDMDILTSGAPILLRDFNCNNNKITSINLEIILNKLNLNYEKWVEFCILCGCDYLKRIYSLGPKMSFKLIKNNTIEQVVETLKSKKEIPDNYLDKFYKAKEIFVDKKLDKEYKFNEELYDNQLVIIKQYLKKNTQLTEKQIDNRIKNIYL